MLQNFKNGIQFGFVSRLHQHQNLYLILKGLNLFHENYGPLDLFDGIVGDIYHFSNHETM